MFHVVLVSPEMPANTGNIIRLCANTGAQLHLVRPFVFSLDDKRLRRAGLDYHEYVRLQVHDDLATALVATGAPAHRRFALSTKGQRQLGSVPFQAGDCFIFGRETAGLWPQEWAQIGTDAAIRLPMLPQSRSLNLSNAVAITLYEAWRHCGFKGAV